MFGLGFSKNQFENFSAFIILLYILIWVKSFQIDFLKTQIYSISISYRYFISRNTLKIRPQKITIFLETPTTHFIFLFISSILFLSML